MTDRTERRKKGEQWERRRGHRWEEREKRGKERREQRGGWDEWDDTALQTQDSKFEPWWSDAEHATSRPRRLTTILTLYEWLTSQAGSFNHCTRAPVLDGRGYRRIWGRDDERGWGIGRDRRTTRRRTRMSSKKWWRKWRTECWRSWRRGEEEEEK